MKIIILGAPGSGKGTQSELIKKKFEITHISTGDIIRNEIKKLNKLNIFLKIKIKKGILIKDKIISLMLIKKLKNTKNILIDGYPRTFKQAILIKKVKIDIIINVHTDYNTIIKRLKYRILYNNHIYNILYKKPKIKNKDNITGMKLKKRIDDKYEIIKNRLNDFYFNNLKIIKWYKYIKNINFIEINENKNTKNAFNFIKKS